MELIEHTIAWCRGEIFEGAFAAAFGLVVVIVAVLFWSLGTTPYSKALLIPMSVVGLLYVAAGTGLAIVNKNRIVQYQAEYERSPTDFLKAEKERAEGFIRGYPVTMNTLAGMIIVGLVLFHLWNAPLGRSIGLALLLLGFSAMFGDHFSEERGRQYYEHILDHSKAGS